jgi:hypothetical protein
MLIAVYSDSTALPRRGLIPVDQTWPNILSSKLLMQYEKECFFLNRSFGGITFEELIELFRRDSAYYFDLNKSKDLAFQSICIFTSGIVDGSPWPITYRLKFLSRIPFIGSSLWKHIGSYLSKFRPLIQSRFAYTPVSIAKFSIELRKLAEISDSLDIFVILLETPMPHSNLEIRSPGILKSIKKFNTAKEKIANSFEQIQYVKLSEFFADDLYISAEDGHHFNITGHGLVADILSNEILKLLSNKA